MRGKVLITLTKKEQGIVEKLSNELLRKKGFEVISFYEDPMLSEDKLIEVIKDIDGYIVGLEKINEKVLEAAKKLKVVCKFGVGTDNIDIKAAEKHGVKVANCPGSNSNAVAELALGLMISLARRIPQLNFEVKQDKWPYHIGAEISGKVLGIVGLGNIGRSLVKLVRGLNMKVLVYDIYQDNNFAKEHSIKYVKLNDLIKQSDFISVHIPLTKVTNNLINCEELNAMKPTAYLINTARGGVINEEALYKAIKEEKIAGAALDTFVNEPPVGSQLVKSDRIIALPHIGAATYEGIEKTAKMAIQNVINII